MIVVRADDDVFAADSGVGSRQHRDDVLRRLVGLQSGVRRGRRVRGEGLQKGGATHDALAHASAHLGTGRGALDQLEPESRVLAREIRRGAVVPGRARAAPLECIAGEIDDVGADARGVRDRGCAHRRRTLGCDARPVTTE
jgi:hypothetical protein